MRLEMIVACTPTGGIGFRGQIPWQIPPDMKHFKQITADAPPGKRNVVIMGRVTYDSLAPRAELSGRINVIVSRTVEPRPGFTGLIARSFNSAIRMIEDTYDPDHIHKVFIIGGSSLYTEALEHADLRRVYVTLVPEVERWDATFPIEDLRSSWMLVQSKDVEWEAQVISFTVYERDTNPDVRRYSWANEKCYTL